MEFYTKEKGDEPNIESKDGVYLVRDHWNDYWKYQTMFDIFCINDGRFKYIGKIKLGMKGLDAIEGDQIGHDMLNLPANFNKLSESYFSLGQSSDYYQNIKDFFTEDELIQFLVGLRDIVHDINIYEEHKDQSVMRDSILRDYSSLTIKGEFRRILTGEAKLTSFKFNFHLKDYDYPLNFHVTPKSLPPTNIHILIGRNGVGKTRFLTKMIKASTSSNDSNYFTDSKDNHIQINDLFASLVMVSFSTFDDVYPVEINDSLIKYNFIGLKNKIKSNEYVDSIDNLKNDFYSSLRNITDNTDKVRQWYKAIETLSEDNVFNSLSVSELIQPDGEKFYPIKEDSIKLYFDHLSSGHRVVLLIITRLIEIVEEKTLVLIDEPENHLHPPLFSMLIRTVSNFLIYRNGVAIIATHSPIILQEVPKECVWIYSRKEKSLKFERPIDETFGENISSLNKNVFKLQLEDATYFNLIKQAVDKYDSLEDVYKSFNYKLGSEAMLLAAQQMYTKKNEGEYSNED